MTAETPRELEHDVERIRGNLTDIVQDLDRRRHEWLDWRLQLRRHPKEAGVGIAVLVLLAGGVTALIVWEKRRRARPGARVRRLGRAVSLAFERRARPATSEVTLAQKAGVAAVSAAAGVLAKVMAERVLWSFRTHDPAT
jgi:hypothetical protein